MAQASRSESLGSHKWGQRLGELIAVCGVTA
jgi:hypothetical protein